MEGGQAALKISSTAWTNKTASSSIYEDSTNNSTLNILYEKDTTTVVYVSLNYMTGSVNGVY